MTDGDAGYNVTTRSDTKSKTVNFKLYTVTFGFAVSYTEFLVYDCCTTTIWKTMTLTIKCPQPGSPSPLRSSIARCTSSFSNTARCKLDRDARPFVLTSVTALPE